MGQSIVGAVIVAIIGLSAHGFYKEQKQAMKAAPARRYAAQQRAEGHPVAVDGKGISAKQLQRALSKDSPAWGIAFGASRRYGVPMGILLSRWFQESSMQMGGDKGGAGGYSALAQIIKKQHEPKERHRWRQFVKNERALRKICAQCGYDCNSIRGSSTGAVGPLQFQPDTWLDDQADGDGDGKACPLNLADALYTAANKLAKDQRRCGSWEGAMSAYGGYSCSRDNTYLRRAHILRPIFQRYADAYAAWQNS